MRLLVIVLAVAGATALAQWQAERLYQKQDIQDAEVSSAAHNAATTRVRIGNSSLDVEIADTDAERAQGLSGRTELAENAGMLFVFDAPGFYNFWMPNMHFSIDIIWVSENRRIIGVAENAPPLDPRGTIIHYTPPAPIAYALETPAGFSAQHNIIAGQQIDFE